MYRAVLIALALTFAACTTWRADPAHSTEVELSSDLSSAQVAAIYNAISEINTAVGREVFHVAGDHPGYAGHVTITTLPPTCDGGCQAETKLRPFAGRIRLGDTAHPQVIAHELLHTVLGGEWAHSTDPVDLFYRRVSRHSVLTEATIARINARMGE